MILSTSYGCIARCYSSGGGAYGSGLVVFYGTGDRGSFLGGDSSGCAGSYATSKYGSAYRKYAARCASNSYFIIMLVSVAELCYYVYECVRSDARSGRGSASGRYGRFPFLGVCA